MLRKNKKKPKVTVAASEAALCAQLRDTYRDWLDSWPNTITHHRDSTRDAVWWDRAAGVCGRYDVPPVLLVYVVFRFLNYDPEEPTMRFGPSIFRSQVAMDRSVVNFRRELAHVVGQAADLYFLDHMKEYVPPGSVLDYARDAAGLSAGYFKQMLLVRDLGVRKATGAGLDPEAGDGVAYNMCNQNPFLLLSVAKTEKYRTLAAVNAWRLTTWQPWHLPVWEGLASEHSLLNLNGLCDPTAVRRYYGEGLPTWGWTYFLPKASLHSTVESKPAPTLSMLSAHSCGKTDFFLKSTRNFIRNPLASDT